MTIFQWLHSVNKQQQLFVAIRVGKLLDQSNADERRHVKGTLNPAYIGTREVTVSQLLESEWLNGSTWLKQNASSWPEQKKLVDDDEIAPTKGVID